MPEHIKSTTNKCLLSYLWATLTSNAIQGKRYEEKGGVYLNKHLPGRAWELQTEPKANCKKWACNWGSLVLGLTVQKRGRMILGKAAQVVAHPAAADHPTLEAQPSRIKRATTKSHAEWDDRTRTEVTAVKLNGVLLWIEPRRTMSRWWKRYLWQQKN